MSNGGPWTYLSCSSPGVGPSAQASLVAQHLHNADGSGRSLGIYSRRRIAGSTSWSVHACGRAIDWAPTSREVGDALFAWLIWAREELDIQLILWRQLQFGGRSGPIIVPTHRQDHNDHLHIEVRR